MFRLRCPWSRRLFQTELGEERLDARLAPAESDVCSHRILRTRPLEDVHSEGLGGAWIEDTLFRERLEGIRLQHIRPDIAVVPGGVAAPRSEDVQEVRAVEKRLRILQGEKSRGTGRGAGEVADVDDDRPDVLAVADALQPVGSCSPLFVRTASSIPQIDRAFTYMSLYN